MMFFVEFTEIFVKFVSGSCRQNRVRWGFLSFFLPKRKPFTAKRWGTERSTPRRRVL